MILIEAKKFLGVFALIAVLLSLSTVYGYIKTRNLITGPNIVVDYPKDGEAINESPIEIRGKAENISSLYLNGRPVFVNEKGQFSEMVALLPGYNILSFKGGDRFGKKTEEIIRLVFKKNN